MLDKLTIGLKAELQAAVDAQDWEQVIVSAAVLSGVSKLLDVGEEKVQVKAHAKTKVTASKKGRHAVLSGKRPTLVVAMRKVIGEDVVDAKEVVARLIKKGWAPESDEPQAYVSGELGKHPGDFIRISRGKYKNA